jgi:outer membrane protein assembly factor BamD
MISQIMVIMVSKGNRIINRMDIRKVLILSAVFALSNCAKDEANVYLERPVEDIYNYAMDLLLDKDYQMAALTFEEVERQHPYSMWSTKSQLMAAYAHYLDNSYDDAVIAAERFISLHPGHADTAYAYYLLGLCYYEQISDVGRDQKMTTKALEAFIAVVKRYPTSEYARDANMKIDLARDHLAGKEMEIGRTYQSLEFYVAAINRFRNVVEDYQTTSHVPEALFRLTETYLALGVTKEAEVAAAVLGHNFPESEWYESSYALLRVRNLEPRLSKRSWLARLF